MTDVAIDLLKDARKKTNLKCLDRHEQVEDIIEEIEDLDLEGNEEIIQWVKAIKNSIKIKETNA